MNYFDIHFFISTKKDKEKLKTQGSFSYQPHLTHENRKFMLNLNVVFHDGTILSWLPIIDLQSKRQS